MRTVALAGNVGDEPALVATANGGFSVASEQRNSFSNLPGDVFFQRFAANGDLIGTTLVNEAADAFRTGG